VASLLLSLLLLPHASIAASPAAAAKRINLIPTPKQLSLKETRHPTDAFRMVIPPDDPLLRNGAEEINRRLADLGGAAMPIGTSLDEITPTIVIADIESELGQRFAQRANVTETRPGEQGYAIQFIRHRGRPLVLALGSDRRGAFYAGITLRRLIRPGEGQPLLRQASVRDAPDFKRRSIGRLWFRHEPNPKQFIRWLGRHKINYLDIRNSWVYDAKGQARENIVEGIRELTTLAERYGITCKMGFMTNLQGFITEQEREKYGGFYRRDGDRYFSWSAKPVHRRRAKVIARFLKDTGIDYMSLHVVDGGGYEDPEGWSNRSERTRQIYGNDHARATADQINIYRTTLKKVLPEAAFEAVPYPYHFQFAIPNYGQKAARFIGNMPAFWWTRRMVKAAENPEQANRTAAKLKAHHRELAKRLPGNVLITFREGGAAEFRGAARLWPGHPIDIWVYLYRTRAWRGLWEPQDRLIKTWYRPDHRDMFYNALMPYARGAVRKFFWSASGAEYTWNTGVPDAKATFTVEHRYYDHGVRNATAYQKQLLIPRVVQRFWGERGDAFAGLLKNNVSFYYLSDPMDMVGRRNRERFLDAYRYYKQQLDAVKQARVKINELVADIRKNRDHPMRSRPARYDQTMNLYWTTNMAAIQGHVQWHYHRARRLAKYERRQEAIWALKQLLAKLPQLRQRQKQVNQHI
jgi:hypothetical protein